MMGNENVYQMIGRNVIGKDGSKIGTVGQVYVDDETGQPTYVTVKTGWFGTRDTFVPVSDQDVTGESINVPHDKDQVQGAPNVEVDDHITEQEEERLHAHDGPVTEGNVGAATSGPEISDEEHEIILREEQPVVITEAVPVERVRLGKEEFVEQQSVTESLRRERIEVEPMRSRRARCRDPAGCAPAGDELGDSQASPRPSDFTRAMRS